jgi:hypothetical protein
MDYQGSGSSLFFFAIIYKFENKNAGRIKE